MPANEPHLDELAQKLAADFASRFGRPPRWMAAAPGRVNLIGEHVDYNGGFVLPMAIERFTAVAADLAGDNARSSHKTARLYSTDYGEEVTFALNPDMARGEPQWSNYVRGVLAGFLNRGLSLPSIEIAVASMVPIGGGLSSSAAIEVAVATLAEAITGHSLDTQSKAILCQKAEHEFAGVPCGIMDQFIAVGGRRDHVMLLDCRSMHFDLIPFSRPDVTVLIINSQVRHSLAAGEYGKRRAQCDEAARILGITSLRDATAETLARCRERLSEGQFRRGRHVVSEIARTTAAADALGREDWAAAGRLMYESHASLRDDFEVSCPELNLLVDLASELGLERGVFGSRMTGGGFGGCTVSLVRSEAVEAVGRYIAKAYRAKTGLEPSLFATRPAGGARVLAITPAA